MKFAKYLAEHQTPEWKRAYIDYAGLKKKLKVIGVRLGQAKALADVRDPEANDSSSAGEDDDHGPSAPPRELSRAISINQVTGRKTDETGFGQSPVLPSSASAGFSLSPPSPKVMAASPLSIERRPGPVKPSPSPKSPLSTSSKPKEPPPLDLGEPSSPSGPDQELTGHQIFRPTSPQPSIAEEPSSAHSLPASKNVSSDEPETPLRPTTGKDLERAKNVLAQFGKSSPKLRGLSPRNSPRMSSPRMSSPGMNSPKVNAAKFPTRTLSMSKGRSNGSPRVTARYPTSIQQLHDYLEPDEEDFFDLLDHELEKVEAFYKGRMLDIERRATDLRLQLRELGEHRRVFHELHPDGPPPEWETAVGRILPGGKHLLNGAATLAQTNVHLRLPFVHSGEDSEGSSSKGRPVSHAQKDATTRTQNGKSESDDDRRSLRQEMAKDRDRQSYDPERYQKYRKELKSAVLEFYRELEIFKNYRILNVTGFRKALKKFEKTTKMHCMELYTNERVMKQTFSNEKTIDGLLKEIEDLYTLRFEHGDSKKARDRLRRQQRDQSHHYSTFRSGACLGLALPACIFALVESFSQEARDAIPAWEGLLQVYGSLFLPVIFAVLFELNLYAWVRARINYEFVMEIARPALDYRIYMEIPSFLFLILSYCFFFSFHRVGEANVAPTTWPAVFLVFVIVFFFNPLPFFHRPARYWLLRVIGRVLTPGYSRVEFIAFFFADELNSLTYTISNIWFTACCYAKKWPEDTFSACQTNGNWVFGLLLCLPALCRLIQCLKRFADSRLRIHLINAGKYASVILQQCLFVNWRSRGSLHKDWSFIVWVIVAVSSAIYTSSWDLIVDWSLLRRDHKMLRPDLGYPTVKPLYYVAMVTNVIVRFIFLWYIPRSHVRIRVRSFVFALTEMLRRWQWNFFRVETEHLGNADAYRVTREVPLPYRRMDQESDEDEDAGAQRSAKAFKIRFAALRVALRKGRGRGPDAPNAGPRGHRAEREYDAPRPGDEEEAA